MALQYRKVIFCPSPTDLYFDEACLSFKNLLNVSIVLYKLYDACYQCDYEFWTSIPPQQVVLLLVPIFTVTSFRYEGVDGEFTSCVVEYQFEQHGLYRYMADLSCDFVHVINLPDYPYTPFFMIIVFFTTIWIIFILLSYLRAKERITAFVRRKVKRKSKENLELAVKSSQVFQRVIYDEEKNEDRIVEFVSRGTNTVQDLDDLQSSHYVKHIDFVEFESLLAFRGLVAMLWIFLKAETGTYPFFAKSPWDGLTLNDLTVGWLYWVLAASFYLRLHYNMRKYGSRLRLVRRTVLLRALLYFLGGVCYNNINQTVEWRQPLSQFPTLTSTRVFGIFQRVSMSYVITGLMEACFIKRNIKEGPCLQDIRDSWPQWSMAVVCVMVHTAVSQLLPVPGCPTGYLGPGGGHDLGQHEQCTGGAAGHLDRLLLNTRNLLNPMAFWGYYDYYHIVTAFDPHGLLGTLTTSLLLTLAMQASRTFIYIKDPHTRLYRLMVSALWQLVLGVFLCSFKKHGGLIAVNVHLMSVSYVFVMSGLAYLTLAIIYTLVTVFRAWNGFPLIYVGVNFLAVIVGSELFQHMLPFAWEIPDDRMYNSNEFLMRGLWSVCAWTVCCYYLLIHQIIFPL